MVALCALGIAPAQSQHARGDITGASSHVRSSTGASGRLRPSLAGTSHGRTDLAGSASLGSIPAPVTTHPRLWVTQADLPRLRRWATSSNPVYQSGIVPLVAQCVSDYNVYWFPGGTANPSWPDNGDSQGYGQYQTEQQAAVLAFASLIDPSPTNRTTYAGYARNLLMHAMTEAALGHAAGQPFRDPSFAVYNRANGAGELWPLTVDWIYSSLSSQDKATIRTAFLIWANDCINASTTGGDHPEPIGTINNVALLPGGLPYRMAANNYYEAHARQLIMMALAMDAADDPLVNGALPASTLGNTLRSYIANGNGAWLYQEYAMFGDASTVATAYGLPSSGFGLASGGLPPEGTLYGHSYSYVLGQLLALQTAGFNDTRLSGPQIGLIGAPVWGRFINGWLANLAPVPGLIPGNETLGPAYQMASYGDTLRTWVTPDLAQPFALKALLDSQRGITTYGAAARWYLRNAIEGGSAGLNSRIANPWAYGVTNSLLYYLVLDPALTSDPDPRASSGSVFVDPGLGRVVAHSGSGATDRMFTYLCPWNSIYHQSGHGGQFSFYRNGEWLTAELSNYDTTDYKGLTSRYHNTLALKNWSANGTPSLNSAETNEWLSGSQWVGVLSSFPSSDPTTVTSSGSGYVFAASVLTNLYNKPQPYVAAAAATDVTLATRSVLWLSPDVIVTYDRATTGHSGLFKRWNVCLATNPALVGSVATETLASGQQLYIQALLPASPTLSVTNETSALASIATGATMRYVLTFEDASNPADARFLNVLQGADAGAPMTAATLIHQTTGVAFDGARWGSTEVYFPTGAAAVTSTVVFTAGAGVHSVYITGLAASTAYTASVVGSTITLSLGGSSTSDPGGVLKVSL